MLPFVIVFLPWGPATRKKHMFSLVPPPTPPPPKKKKTWEPCNTEPRWSVGKIKRTPLPSPSPLTLISWGKCFTLPAVENSNLNKSFTNPPKFLLMIVNNKFDLQFLKMPHRAKSDLPQK